MRERLKSMRRLLSVQKDLHRIEEWKFAAIERRRVALKVERERLVAYLDDDRLFALAYVGTIAERLRVLAQDEERLTQQREAQIRILLEKARQMGQTARAAKAVALQCQRAEEKEELEAAIEAALARQRASFP